MNQVGGGSRYAQGEKVTVVSQNNLCWILNGENITVNHRKYYQAVASQNLYCLYCHEVCTCLYMQQVLPEEQAISNSLKFAKTFQIFDQALRREIIANQPSKLSDLSTFDNTGKHLCRSLVLRPKGLQLFKKRLQH